MLTSSGKKKEALGAARVAGVRSQDIITHFNDMNTVHVPIVGLFVVSISSSTWDYDDTAPPVPFADVLEALKAGPFPIFVQMSDLQELTVPVRMQLVQTMNVTNRQVRHRETGEFEFSSLLDADLTCGVSTVAIPMGLPEFGRDMVLDMSTIVVCGFRRLPTNEMLEAIARSTSSSMFIYTHGFGTSMYFALVTSAIYCRCFQQPLVLLMTWPSNPKAEGVAGGWAISKFMSTLERNYVAAEQHMHASCLPLLTLATLVRDKCALTKKRMHWKAHSMGCYLLLQMMEKLHLKGDLAGMFSKVILDAPDVPTWYFRQVVNTCASLGVDFLHLYSPNDKATDASRVRRNIEPPCPGNDVVLVHDRIQTVNCCKAVSTNSFNHDYGRRDGFTLMDQRDFLADIPPKERLLDLIVEKNGASRWSLRTGR
uniref:Uncharacterized protein n=1 Tax=Octactis speculum TaxID=3111310 RepID=A0A7S2F989_9STRA